MAAAVWASGRAFMRRNGRASVVEARQLRLWGCSGGRNAGPRRLCRALVKMVENASDDGGVFDAGDDPEVGAAGIADIDVDVAYRDVGQGREQDAEALNTRFKRLA